MKLKTNYVLFIPTMPMADLFSESGRVFMFGPNNWGELGIGQTKLANKPSCIKCELSLPGIYY